MEVMMIQLPKRHLLLRRINDHLSLSRVEQITHAHVQITFEQRYISPAPLKDLDVLHRLKDTLQML